MSAPLAACLLPLALLFQLPGGVDTSADAVYVEQREFTSPVTGDKFYAPVLKAALRAQNYDYDRCPHPPANTLAYALVIDPETGYTAYAASFEQPCPWKQDELAEILGHPKFKHDTPDDMPWASAYPWEKFENAAVLAHAANRPAGQVAELWLLAAWSVRLDVISGRNEFDTEVSRIFNSLPRIDVDPARLTELPELRLAQRLCELRDSGQLGTAAPRDVRLALAWLYRSRGELPQAQAELDALLAADAEFTQGNLLYRYLVSSIELERGYLRLAREWLSRAWDAGEVQDTNRAWAAFLLGETCRRAGEDEAARRWYGEAATYNRGTLSVELIQRQLKLAGGSAADAAVSKAY